MNKFSKILLGALIVQMLLITIIGIYYQQKSESEMGQVLVYSYEWNDKKISRIKASSLSGVNSRLVVDTTYVMPANSPNPYDVSDLKFSLFETGNSSSLIHEFKYIDNYTSSSGWVNAKERIYI
ncbi:hypothetical protein A9Q99_10245 [Gammaproteobacteria bacterium 45_16_T64]|mgnify:CR=1 FL=1|nr:hypothetical protein A9Q99_10245 [Gammaproteobacteria bacterium 45_16_T64]